MFTPRNEGENKSKMCDRLEGLRKGRREGGIGEGMVIGGAEMRVEKDCAYIQKVEIDKNCR